MKQNTINVNPNNTLSDLELEEIERKAAAEASAKAKKRYKQGVYAAESTLRASATDDCDWRQNLVELLRGDVCGKHYKVLGLDKNADRVAIKKAYRSKSLDIHPDKNPSKSAQTAFQAVQEAYECLSEKQCRSEYDARLEEAELVIRSWRQEKVHLLLETVKSGLLQGYLYLSIAAEHVTRVSARVWELAGRWEVLDLPAGRVGLLLGLALSTFGRRLLMLYGVATSVSRFNHELARSKGYFQ
eukprot:CAMPEP_0182422560 /NCGR_PEP_ID=MMETSP1167-20130531/8292_1 /TAXON_ID=2988 /ORGANISM="Mallomonas Sp, Strain CCMP3275" /LENGTH=242 /DNA_ID=CAMNT_0024600729 /DNA_START=458 /DNA_END=1185 /DNA_ORIENTATION=+